MANICNHPGCTFEVFSKGKCHFHYERKPIIRNKALQQTKSLQRHHYIKKKRSPTGELNLFKEIWKERPHQSELSGKRLFVYQDPDTKELDIGQFVLFFAHILSKKMYSKFRLRKDNIFLLTPKEHHLLDQGTEEQRKEYALQNNCDWNIIYKKSDELKQLYKTTL